MAQLPFEILSTICNLVSQDEPQSASDSDTSHGGCVDCYVRYRRRHPKRVRLASLSALARSSKALQAAATPLLYTCVCVGSGGYMEPQAGDYSRSVCSAVDLRQSRLLLRTLTESRYLAHYVQTVNWYIEVH